MPGLSIVNLLLILTSYFLVYFINKRTRFDSLILLLILLSTHHLVAFLFGFYLERPQNEVDPVSFVYLAGECINFSYCGYFGPHLYANYLARVFMIEHSIYTVFLVNIIFFVASLYFFIHIGDILFQKNDINRKIMTVLFGLWPSVIYFSTLNYRETFEIFFLVAATFYGLSGSKDDNFIKMGVSMTLFFIMGLLHMKGLTFLSPILFLIVLSYRPAFKLASITKKLFLIIIMSMAVYSSQGLYSEFLNDVAQSKLQLLQRLQLLQQEQEQEQEQKTVKPAKMASQSKPPEEKVLSESSMLYEKNKDNYLGKKNYPDEEPDVIDKIIRKIAYYRASLTWVRPPSSAFLTNVSDTSLLMFLATYLLVYIEYLFSPFIFQVNSFLGLLAYAESLLRLILFLSALIFVKRHPQARVLFILYLAITGMWALGVVSYGASIRHHVQTNWILILLGIPVISGYVHRKFLLFQTRKER